MGWVGGMGVGWGGVGQGLVGVGVGWWRVGVGGVGGGVGVGVGVGVSIIMVSFKGNVGKLTSRICCPHDYRHWLDFGIGDLSESRTLCFDRFSRLVWCLLRAFSSRWAHDGSILSWIVDWILVRTRVSMSWQWEASVTVGGSESHLQIAKNGSCNIRYIGDICGQEQQHRKLGPLSLTLTLTSQSHMLNKISTPRFGEKSVYTNFAFS